MTDRQSFARSRLSSPTRHLNRIWIALTLATLIAGCNADDRDDAPSQRARESESTVETASQADKPTPQPSHHEQKPDPADAMRQLRHRTLTAKPAEFGIQETEEFPKVYGALAEFPIGDSTATIVSLCDGNASLYTTSTFGVIGGQSHETVRNAATAFVKATQAYCDDATTTTDFPYPKSDRVRFYLLTFSGTRFIDTDLASIEAGSNKYSGLFEKANDVLTQLRLMAEQSNVPNVRGR